MDVQPKSLEKLHDAIGHYWLNVPGTSESKTGIQPRTKKVHLIQWQVSVQVLTEQKN